jgi:hypothetical protein
MDDTQRRFEILANAHYNELEKRYGDKSKFPNGYNAGWSQSDDCIMSKIYSNPRKFFSSYRDEDSHKIIHEETGE